MSLPRANRLCSFTLRQTSRHSILEGARNAFRVQMVAFFLQLKKATPVELALNRRLATKPLG